VTLNQLVGPTAGDLIVLGGDLARMQLHAPVVEADVRKIRPGMLADLTLPGEDERMVKGKVVEVRLVPVSERGAVYYPVILDVENERGPDGQWLLRPGLTADADVVLRAHEGVWKVPTAALQFHPEEATLSEEAKAKLARPPAGSGWQAVWVVRDGRPWPLFARTGGLHDGQWTEVLEWEPGWKTPEDAADFPQVITGVVPPKKGLFSPPQIKF
jgi:HlyD family secretion protein